MQVCNFFFFSCRLCKLATQCGWVGGYVLLSPGDTQPLRQMEYSLITGICTPLLVAGFQSGRNRRRQPWVVGRYTFVYRTRVGQLDVQRSHASLMLHRAVSGLAAQPTTTHTGKKKSIAPTPPGPPQRVENAKYSYCHAICAWPRGRGWLRWAACVLWRAHARV